MLLAERTDSKSLDHDINMIWNTQSKLIKLERIASQISIGFEARALFRPISLKIRQIRCSN